MKIFTKLFSLIAVFLPFSALAQMYFSNPSFEGPTGTGISPAPWGICCGTADTEPGQFGVTMAASNGSTYLGLWDGSGLGSGCSNVGEGDSEPLPCALRAGKTYTFTVDLAWDLHAGVTYTQGATMEIYGGMSSCARTQLLWSGAPTAAGVWQTKTVTFTPTSNWTYISFFAKLGSGNKYILYDNLGPISRAATAVTKADASCNGPGNDGTATVTPPADGTAWNYLWSNGQTTATATGLAPGSYTCKITDPAEACPIPIYITTIIQGPPSVTVTASPTTICAGQTSQLTATVPASTPPSCVYTLNLFDSFGDGWSTPAKVQVYVKGVLVGTYTLGSGSAGSVTITVTQGDAIQLKYTASSSFNSDNTYELRDASSALVYTSGANPATNSGWTGTANCGYVAPVYTYTWTPAASLNNAAIFNPVATPATTTTYTVKVASSTNPGCSATKTQVITVNPSPTVTASPQTICSGTASSVALSSPMGGATFAWGVPVVTGGITGGAAGSGAIIAQTLTNPGTTPGTVTYSVTPTAAGCPGTPVNVVVTVNPTPNVTGAPVSICSGSTSAVALSSTTPGTTFTWNAPTVTGGITGSSAGSGASISQTLTNPGTSSGTVTYSVTPTLGVCSGTPVNIVITVKPTPNVLGAPQSICSGSVTSVALTSGTAGTTFAWNAPAVTGGITGSAAGSGTPIAQTLTNPGTTAGTVTYVVTPTNAGCIGTPLSIVVTVNPLPNVTATPSTQRICSATAPSIVLGSNVTGATFAWNAPVVTGGITGSSLGSGSSISQTLTNPGTSSGTVTYSVTPTANGCTGTPVSVVITVDPVPVATVTPATQTFCSGGTTGINITSNVAGSSFAWTVAGGVSGSSNGTGASIAQTLTNASASAQIATYTVTPTGPAPSSCVGLPVTATVTVNPTPTVTATPSAQTICSGTSSSIILNGTVAGTTFSWSAPVVTGGITGASAGAGGSISQTLTNPGTSSGTVTYSVTPTANGCPGTPITVVVTVDPTPSVTATPNTQDLCSGATTGIALTGPVTGTIFNWTVAGGVAGSSNGTGASIAQTLTNLTTLQKTATYTITPTGPAPSNCVGLPITVIIKVSPIPDVTPTPVTQTICSGVSATIGLTSSVGGTTFAWTVSGGVAGSAAGSGSSINETLTNLGAVAVTATHSITPTGPAPSSCVGTPVNATIIVNPLPAAPAVISPLNYCQSATASPLTATGTNLLWYDGAGVLIGATAPTPSTTVATTLTYQVSQTVNGCEGPKSTITIVINPPPAAPSSPSPLVYCQGQAIPALTATGSGAAGSILKWYSDAGLTSQVGTGSPFSSGATVTTTFYVIEESAAGCKGPSKQVVITVNPKDNAGFTYSSNTYCRTGTNPTPVIITPGGSFVSSPAGLNINSSTGTITLSTSAVGSYKIVYTTAATCPNKDSVTVNITDSPDPTFTIGGPYCQFGTDPSPVFTPPATPGLFSASPAGLVFDVNTGDVDLTLSTPGSYTLTNTIAAGGGCAMVADAHPVVINATPSVTAKNDTICSGTSTNIVFNNPNAGTINTWTVSSIVGAVSGSSAGSGASINQTLTITGTTVGKVTYHVIPSSASSTCTGTPIDVTVLVNPLPAAPAVTSPLSYCQNDVASALSATPTTGTIQWYNSGNTFIGTTAPVPSTAAAPATLTYYASEKVGKCEGPKSTITITINPTPLAPTAPSPAAYCQGAAIAPLTASGAGGTFKWYSDAALTSQIGIGTPFNSGVTATTDFWVTETKSGCTGPATKVTITVNPKDDASFAYGSGTFCITGGNQLPASITKPGGIFSAAAPVVINSSTGQIDLVATGLGGPFDITYTTNGTCPNSSVVKVTITNAPSATFSYAGPYCNSAANPLPTIPAGSSSGTFSASPATLVWVGTTTGEINLALTPAGTYTITNFIAPSGGCASATATNTVTINPSPAAPAVVPVVYCENATASPLTATPSAGGILNWYPGPTATAPTPVTTVGGTTTNYQVSQTVSGCEGPKATISVTINPTPIAPTASSPAAYCQGASIASLTASGTGGTLKWYKQLPLTPPNQVGTGNPFSSGATSTTSFYVTETVAGCEGPGTKVDITVNPLDNPAFSYSSGTYCVSGVTNPTPTITGLAGGTFTSSPAGLTLNPSTGQITLSSSAANNYTVTYTTNGPCPQSSTVSVSLVTSAIAGFSYAGPYCKTAPDPSPVFVAGASAGNFTSTLGLTLNAATGQVTLATSTPGTYTVTNTITGGGCVPVSATASITVNPTPGAPAVLPLTFCKGDPSSPLTPNGAGYQWYNGSPGSPVPTPTPSTATPGITDYYVTQTIAGCEGPSADLTVTVNALPAAPVVSNVNYCQNATATPLTSSALNPKWYAPISTLLGGAPTPNTSSTVTTSYWVTETTNGCEGPKAKLQVFVNSTPAPVVSNITLCENDVASPLTATTLPGATTQWYDATNNPIPTPTPLSTPTGTTTYNVTQTLNTCESVKAPLVVTVNAPPVPIVNPPAPYCVGNAAAQLAAQVTTAGNSLKWYDGANTYLGPTAPTPSTAGPGTTTYFVSQVSASNPAGCEGPKAQIDVVVNFTPAPVTTPVSYCQGATATALTPNGGNYLWYNLPNGIGGVSTITPSTALPATFDYYVDDTQNGCRSTLSQLTVTVNPSPNPPSVIPPTICANNPAQLDATAPAGCSFNWYDATGTTLLGTGSSFITPVLNNSTSYQVEATDITTGCIGSKATYQVTVNQPIDPTGTASPVCEGSFASAQVDLPWTPGATYNWHTSPVGGSVYATGGSINTTAALTTTTTLYVDAILNGCTGNRSPVVITVNPTIFTGVSITTTTRVCENTPIVLTAIPVNGGTPSYQWYKNNSALGGNSSTLNDVPVNGDVYRVDMTSTVQCPSPLTSTYSVTIQVDATDKPVLAISPDHNPICIGTPVTFNVTDSTTSGTSRSYQWFLNGIPVGTGSSYSSSTFANNDLVSCVMTSNAICPSLTPAQDQKTMIVNGPPAISITPVIAQGCDPLTVDYTLVPNMTYKWSFNGIDTVDVTSANYSHTYHYSDGASQSPGIRVIDQSTGCYSRATVNATVFEQPVADFTYSPDVISNLSPYVEVTDKTAASVNSWSWTYSDGGSGTGKTMEHQFPKEGNYDIGLQVTTSNGCTDFISKTVSVIEDYAIFIPDAFSPNGDGVNETFVTKGIGVKSFDMWVFDRWGSQVYHSSEMSQGWDGKAFGKADVSQIDIYVYKIITTDYLQRKHEYNGKIQLLK